MLRRWIPEIDMSQMEDKFVQMCADKDDQHELEHISKKVLTKCAEKMAYLKEEKNKLKLRIEGKERNSEERQVLMTAERMVLERKQIKGRVEMSCLIKERLNLEKEDEERERHVRATAKDIEDLNKEIDDLTKTAQWLKFGPRNTSSPISFT
uniref:Coiled-coil domain-containing protein 39 n=1 Tax=Steinernema glaseri TaxID=37863 RepID=A0A1I7ZKH2_9BILA